VKRSLAIILLLAAWLALCGMGLFPEGPVEVPKTKDNFSVTIHDTSGVSTRLTRFSIDGETFLPARRGQGSLTIPFERIEEMTFQDGKATVKVKDGQPVEVSIDRRLTANGLSDYGPYRITLKEVRRVVVHGQL
jgi:hypothetical protein